MNSFELLQQSPSCASATGAATSRAGGSEHVASASAYSPRPIVVSTSTSTGTSVSLQSFTSAVSASNSTAVVAINAEGNASDGNQTLSGKTVEDLNQLGSNRAATVGALFCAQGANASISNDPDAQAYYAGCHQNFNAAKLMNAKSGIQPDQATVDGSLAKETLTEFEKNFGISGGDFLSRMLGSGLGAAGLGDLVGDKISAEKLAADLEAASQLDGSAISQDPGRYAVNLGSEGLKPKNAQSLRDKLKANMANQNSESRDLASAVSTGNTLEKYDSLTPLTEGLFAPQETDEGLTLFDVMHLRYAEIRKRWRH